jgi:SpoVK/Ycf46/Vps4 family AAA+-type ATPase
MDTFFHERKNEIWTNLKHLQTNPTFFEDIGQSPQLNYLLYGPPGTGKSNFAYRIARALQRHIVSVDILSVGNKCDIFNIMKRPFVNGWWLLQPSQCVYVFDEFDITVKALYERDIESKKTEKQLFEISATNKYIGDMIDDVSPAKDKGKDEDKDTTAKKKEDTSTEPKLSRSEMLEKVISDVASSSQVKLRDLLEILQGPVPLNGAIIIATSNKFDDMKKMCPELFRPGRLTPIYCGNLNGKLIKEVSKKFFNTELDIANDVVSKVCPADIFMKVSESCIDSQKGFSHFKNYIDKVALETI